MKLILILLAVVLLAGCTATRTAEVQIVRQMKTVTVETSQTIAPNGIDIIELTKRTTAVTDEQTGHTTQEKTITEPPRIVGQLAKAAVTFAAAGLGGPVAANAVSQGMDWINSLLTGGTGAATAAGVGYMALKKAKRQTTELIDGIENAKDVIPKDIWTLLTTELRKAQNDDTVALVRERTA